MSLAFYIDEDATDTELVRGLRLRSFDVLTAAEADLLGRSDPDQLAFATSKSRVLYSFNVADYHEIHTSWSATGRPHAGLLLAQQRRYSIGEQIRRIVRLSATLSAEEMRSREEFLGTW